MVNQSSRTRPHNGWWRAPSTPRRLPSKPTPVADRPAN